MADLLDEGVILIPFDEEDNESNGNIAEENGVDGPMARSEIDLPEGPLFRFQAYRKAWDDCLERIKVLLLKLQKPIVEEAIQCIYESALKPDDEFLLPVQEIMTVVISCSDRAFAHTSLHYVRTILMMTGEPEDKLPRAMVSQIHDTDCTNLASMVKAMIAGFRSDPFHEKLNLKSSSDIQVLQSWIEEVKTELDTDILMIIILPDMSLIAPSLLADFLDLCHCHISDLPFTILTTASDTGYLNRTLPRSTLVKLRLEHFNLPCDRQVIEHIIEETFFSPEFVPRLMIGPSSLEMIISEYSQNNTTLDNLLSNLQILHLQHFYNPLSLLCVSSFDSFLSTTLQEPEESSKWMPFMKHVRLKLLSQNMSNSDWLDFSPVKVMENAIKGRNSFHTRIRDMKVALRIWGIIQKFCRARGVKAKTASLSLLEIQMKALQTGMGDTIADAVVSSFKALDRVQTEALLEELFYFINNLPAALRNLTTGIRSQIVASMNQPNKSGAFCDFLVRYFRSTLISFDDIPLLDIWVTNEDTLPNSPFNPNVHVSIVTALLEPQGYLDWGTSHKQKDTSPLPDITLAFQRYVDSGRMINLYDWYQTFVTAFEGHDESEGEDEEDLMDIEDTPTKPRNKRPSRLTKGSKINKDKPRVDKKELQARFMRTVHELEFVGFLKRTGRRTEHVVKTVFDVMD